MIESLVSLSWMFHLIHTFPSASIEDVLGQINDAFVIAGSVAFVAVLFAMLNDLTIPRRAAKIKSAPTMSMAGG